jgi:hypothetical protein
MSDALGFLFSQFASFYNALSAVSFTISGVTVTLTQIILGFICMSIIISFFWKGARG